MSDIEEPRPPREIIVSESEKWAERPIKVQIREQTHTGSAGEAIRISEDEAFAIMNALDEHLWELRRQRNRAEIERLDRIERGEDA